jgi:hypothetical protein
MCPTPATAAAAEILARSIWFEQLSAQRIGDIVSRQWLDEHSRRRTLLPSVPVPAMLLMEG